MMSYPQIFSRNLRALFDPVFINVITDNGIQYITIQEGLAVASIARDVV